MFAAGPATIAATRFHVAARQYASGPSASSRSSRLLRATEAAVRRELPLVHELDGAPGRESRAASWSPAASAPRRRFAAPPSSGASARIRPEPDVDVDGRRAMHPGDLHEASERDRADPVLDPVPRRLPDRRREADVEAPRAHPEHEGHHEVPELVHEDQHPEAQDRDEDRHAGCNPIAASLRASSSAAIRSSRSRAGAPSTRASVSSTTAAMSRKPIRRSRNAATATSLAAL